MRPPPFSVRSCRIPGVRGAQAYLHQHREGLAVIDPGYTGSFRAVLRFVEAQALGRIDWVVLTHHHIDHAGTALALCQATGARLAVHTADAAYLQPRRPRERMTLWGLADRLPVGLARFVVTCAGRAARLLEDGETIAGLTVVHGPGHTPGVPLEDLPEESRPSGDLIASAKELDTHYIPTPYPDGFERGARSISARGVSPSRPGIASAEGIVEWCRRQIGR